MTVAVLPPNTAIGLVDEMRSRSDRHPGAVRHEAYRFDHG